MKSDKNKVTLFFCSELARYCAPSAPILFSVRSNTVSFCENNK